MGVPGTRPVLDVPAHRRDGALGGDHLPGLLPRLAVESRGNLPWLFLYSSLSIPAFYAVGLLTHTQSTFAIGDFWRFWVVHLWVEDFLELFTTMLVALIFVLMGIVSERFATRLIYFDVMLYSVGGVVGTLHHCYFSGGPAVEMALGRSSRPPKSFR